MGSLASGQNRVVTAPRTHPLGAVFMARVFMRSSHNITYYRYIIGLFYCPLKYTYSSRTEYLCHIVIDYLNFPKIVQCVVIKVLKFHVLNVQGEGYSGFQVTRMDEWYFWVRNFHIFDFLVDKFVKYTNTSFQSVMFFFVGYIISPFWNLRVRNSAWDFLGVYFWSMDFFGSWFSPHIDHPCLLKSWVPTTRVVECIDNVGGVGSSYDTCLTLFFQWMIVWKIIYMYLHSRL